MPVAGHAGSDLRAGRRHLGGLNLSGTVDGQFVVVVIRRLDNQLADRGVYALQVPHLQLVNEVPVRQCVPGDQVLDVRVLDLGVSDIRHADPCVRDGSDLQRGLDGRQVVRVDGVCPDCPGSDQLRGDDLAGDLLRRDAVGGDLPGRYAPGLQVLAPNRALGDASACYRPALDVIPGNGRFLRFVAECGLFVPLQDRVEHVPGHLDHGVHAHRAVNNPHPFRRSRIAQRDVLPVFFGVRHVDPVKFQRDLRLVGMVHIKAVLRGLAHPGDHFAFGQLHLGPVRVGHLLPDFQLGIQYLRANVWNLQPGVDALLRKRQPRAVLVLCDGVHPRDNSRDVPGPLHRLQVHTVADLIRRVRFLVRYDVHVPIVPDRPGGARLQQSVLRIQDCALCVLPAPVRFDLALVDPAVQPARVFLLHRARNEQQRRRRADTHHAAFPQHGPPKLIADVLRFNSDIMLVGLPVDVVDGEQLLRDVECRDHPVLRLSGRRAVRNRDVSLQARQRRRFHVGAVKILHLHDGSAAGQRGDFLAGICPGAGDLRPQPAVRRRYAQTAVARHALPVLLVVGYLIALHIAAERLPVGIAHRNGSGDLAVQFRAGIGRVVADLAQVDGAHMLRRDGNLQNHPVVDPDVLRRLPGHGHRKIVPPVVLPGDFVLGRVQLNAVRRE